MPEEPREPLRFEPQQLAIRIPRSDQAALCRRALAGLQGLAAKHGATLRGVEDRVELVVHAKRAAALVTARGSLAIEVYEPERTTLQLGGADVLSTALDRLEGLLRKLLGDRRARTSEGGIRSALAPLLERAGEAELREGWPLGDADGEPVDWVGLGADARCLVGAVREELDLPGLARILDGVVAAPEVAVRLATAAGRALGPERPRLLIAATEFDAAALDACSALQLDIDLFQASTRRNGDWALELLERPQVDGSARSTRAASVPSADRADEDEPAEREARPRRESRPRRERSRSAKPEAEAETEEEATEATGSGSRFEEVSLFDLDEDSGSSAREEGGGRRRRRRRRGRRGRGSSEGGGNGGGGDDADSGSSAAPGESADPGRSARSEDEDADVVDLEQDDETLAPLAEDAPDLDESQDAALDAVDDEDDDADDSEESRESERSRRERELRRRARAGVRSSEEPPPAPRRRAAFLAHADRASILTAVILARDVRLVESFWIYPQGDLMTFFRSVATDLGDQTPIFLVGFAASPPARDTLQSAALYRGRLDWFDHHDWPPEDLESLRATLGTEHVHIEPGGDSSLAAVIGQRNRRSRFSDKLMELLTGRFTQHDYERWGRWWWHRLGELTELRGDRRAEIAPLLAGRPSDLAKAVAKSEEPPLPPELAFVSERDFRLVHFGGLSMVVLEVPETLDLHLSARIARERYEAELSLATRPERSLVVLGTDDGRTKRSLDLAGLAAHLSTKHAWVEPLADDDHVARLLVHGLHGSGRLDELITEIAMGRSIVEG